jgi:hypothetical protein
MIYGRRPWSTRAGPPGTPGTALPTRLAPTDP